MKNNYLIKSIPFYFLFFTILYGCVTPVMLIKEPPLKIEGFMNAKWGCSVEECKKAIEKDGNKWFEDKTDRPPYAIYAHGVYFGSKAIFSYFFTPKSKKLYRVDLTYDDLTLYANLKDNLLSKLKEPSYSQKDIDHWSWKDRSLVILQRDSENIQLNYSNGPLLELNKEEGGLERSP